MPETIFDYIQTTADKLIAALESKEEDLMDLVDDPRQLRIISEQVQAAISAIDRAADNQIRDHQLGA